MAVSDQSIELYADASDPCIRHLWVRCRDQIGVLYHLAELLTKHCLDLQEARVTTADGLVNNHMVLHSVRPGDLERAYQLCHEMQTWLSEERSLKILDAESLAEETKKLSVNQDLLSVASFEEMEPSHQTSAEEVWYGLELRGINQTGLLAYTSLVLFHSGFNIISADISTCGGHVVDTFVLSATSRDCERRLRSYFLLPPKSTSNPTLLWPMRTTRFSSDDTQDWSLSVDNSSIAMSSAWRRASSKDCSALDTELKPDCEAKRATFFEQVPFANGDMYHGYLCLGDDGTARRHGDGTYKYRKGSTHKEYRGQWQNDKKHGHGVLLFSNGSAYVGQWRDDKREGDGVMFDTTGSRCPADMPGKRYEGQWLKGDRHGLGVEDNHGALYCGHFEADKRSNAGVRIQTSPQGVPICSVLRGSEWTHLSDVFASGDSIASFKVRAHPFRALAGAYEKNSAVPTSSSQTYHFTNQAKSNRRPALSSVVFEETEEAEAQAETLELATPQVRADISEPVLLQVRADISEPAFVLTEESNALDESTCPPDVVPDHLTLNVRPMRSSSAVGDVQPTTRRASKTSCAAELMAGAAERGQRKWSKSAVSSAAFATPTRGESNAATIPPDHEVPKTASARFAHMRRESTPCGKTSTQRNTAAEARKLVTCPVLWDEAELATFIDCLGLDAQIVEAVSRRKLRGAAQLLEMTDAEMSSELGMTTVLERLLVRRSLQRLLELERWGNSAQGRSFRDIVADPVLAAHTLPLEDMRLTQVISEGGFGVVYRGHLRITDPSIMPAVRWRPVAVKEMKGDRQRRLYELLKEAIVMASLRHPNICEFVGVCADAERGKRFLVSELMDCSLFELVHKPHKFGILTISMSITLSAGIAAGLAYLHGKNLVHADLKSPNILVQLPPQAPPIPKICDFGHAAVRAVPCPHNRLCTPNWAAPEVLREEALGTAADVFSLGILMWEMLTGQLPHAGLCFTEVIAAVGWAGLIPNMKLLPQVRRQIKRLLLDCLCFAPSDRPSSKECEKRLRDFPRRARNDALLMAASFFFPSCFR